MAFLQHGAACIRGLAPLSRAAAAASSRSSRHALRGSDLLLRGSIGEGAEQPSSSAKQEDVVRSLHQIKNTPLAELKSAFNQEISAPRAQTLGQTHLKGDQETAQLATGGQADTFKGPGVQIPESKSIADIYGPYEPSPSVQAGGVAKTINGDQAVSVSLTDGVDKVSDKEGRVVDARGFQTGVSHADSARLSPEVVHPAAAKQDAPASALRSMVPRPAESVLQSSSPKRIPLEVNTSTNASFSVGVAPPLPPPHDSNNSAYAAFSAFAVLPLLLVLIISWVTYSSYSSKRRPLEIKVGQDGGHAGDIENGNGKAKHAQSTLIQQIVERLPQLKEVYKPYPGLTNRHVETIFAAFFRKLPNVQFRRECLAAPDGGTVALDWPVHGGKRPSDEAMWGQELPAGSPVLILLVRMLSGYLVFSHSQSGSLQWARRFQQNIEEYPCSAMKELWSLRPSSVQVR